MREPCEKTLEIEGVCSLYRNTSQKRAWAWGDPVDAQRLLLDYVLRVSGARAAGEVLDR